MVAFNNLNPRPADALLGLMAAFRADERSEKVDLGVGVYRDETGITPVMDSVRAAEIHLANTITTKVYESPRGNQSFTASIEKAVFGSNDGTTRDAFSTAGGCGALTLGMSLIKRASPDNIVYISTPTWPNHPHVIDFCGLKSSAYPYIGTDRKNIDLDGMISVFKNAPSGSAILLQGPCHNPTGVDLSSEEWSAVAEVCVENTLLPFLDIAYHGFAQSLEKDISNIRAFLEKVPNALVSYSCSKNFGLYRERTGCLLLKAENSKSRDAASSHLADITRAINSMPPAHGQAIVATIFEKTELETRWRKELELMRNRMIDMRKRLSSAIHPKSNSFDPSVLNSHNGMFSQLPLSADSISALREDHGIYIPDSGRINVAGLLPEDIERTAALLSDYL